MRDYDKKPLVIKSYEYAFTSTGVFYRIVSAIFVFFFYVEHKIDLNIRGSLFIFFFLLLFIEIPNYLQSKKWRYEFTNDKISLFRKDKLIYAKQIVKEIPLTNSEEEKYNYLVVSKIKRVFDTWLIFSKKTFYLFIIFGGIWIFIFNEFNDTIANNILTPLFVIIAIITMVISWFLLNWLIRLLHNFLIYFFTNKFSFSGFKLFSFIRLGDAAYYENFGRLIVPMGYLIFISSKQTYKELKEYFLKIHSIDIDKI